MKQESGNAHILITGVTGFVGQALLERLLFSYPHCRVSVLVRARGEISAQERVIDLLSRPVFDTLRAQIGADELRAMVQERVSVLPGDLAELPVLPADLDVVLHSASNVNFDPEIDEAFVANVAGPAALYRSLVDAGADPHVVHVSTSYAVGLRKGVATETSLVHDVDYERELRWALDARAAADELSRTPEILDLLMRSATREHRRAGHRAVAEATEESRLAWIKDRLITQGRSRARSLGWSDAYTMTKAMGERVAELGWAATGHRLSIVRPTIIESALRHPYPGWIDGYKVADPLIAAFGRGQLPEFPALADTIMDIIPVDFVVNAILAAAFNPGPPQQAQYFQVCSGTTKPLRLGEMVRLTTEHFTAHPLPDVASPVAQWNFPHPAMVGSGVRRRGVMVGVADALVAQLPATQRTRGWSAMLHKASRDLNLLSRMIAIYEPYTKIEVIFDDRRLRQLHAGLDPQRLPEHGFDVTEIDWRCYLQDVHIPQIPNLMRRRAAANRPAANPELPRRDDVLAVFDLQRTVATGSLVEHYLWLELARRPIRWPVSVANMVMKSPHYWWTERQDRADFIRTFMRRYAGCTEEELRKIVAESVTPSLQRSLLIPAINQVEAHRAAGHRTILITGQIDIFVEPLAALFDEVISGAMDIDDDGRWTGHLAVNPVVGEARAGWLRSYAGATGMDLTASYAYGDSYADRPWLDEVGFPHAVNPDLQLYRYAQKRRWPTRTWTETLEGPVAPLLRSLRASL